MPRTKLRRLTLEILQENDLPKKKILEEVRKESGKAVSDKTINEILMNLLKDGEIYISGYDFQVYGGMKRIQSIKADGIIFGYMKVNPLEIALLINQLDSNDSEIAKESSYKLKIIFRRKLDGPDMNEIKINNIDSLFNKIMYYINTQTNDQKTVLTNKLAWSLSEEDESSNLLKSIIEYVNS